MRLCRSRLPHLTPGSRFGSSHRQRVDVGASAQCISVTRLLSGPRRKPVMSAGPGGATPQSPLTERRGVAGGPENGVPGQARS